MKTHSELVWETVHSRSGAALSAIAASWCRSALKHGLDPAASPRHERATSTEIGRARETDAPLLRITAPILDGLHAMLGKSGCCVILTNSDGLILERRSAAADARIFDDDGLALGARWDEATEGTNGIGTCLAEARPVTIHRGQHFHSRNARMSCMDAPVHDEQGRLIAALDVSSSRYDHGEATAALVAAVVGDAARRIERAYFIDAFRGSRILCADDADAAGLTLLALDDDDLVIGATRFARHRFGLTQSSFAAPRPVSDVLGLNRDKDFAESERGVLRRALARSGGNVSAAARSLGIGRATFYRRMSRAGLSDH